jgi:hypothetical protein
MAFRSVVISVSELLIVEYAVLTAVTASSQPDTVDAAAPPAVAIAPSTADVYPEKAFCGVPGTPVELPSQEVT